MRIVVSQLLLAFILIVLSDGVAAVLAGRACWRMRRKSALGLPFAVMMWALALESLNSIVNHSVNMRGVEVPSAYLVQAGGGRLLKSIATWGLALKLMNGYSSSLKGGDNETTTTNTGNPGVTGDPDC